MVLKSLMTKEYADEMVKEYFEFTSVDAWIALQTTYGVKCYAKTDELTGLNASKSDIILDYTEDQIKDFLLNPAFRTSYDSRFDFDEVLNESTFQNAKTPVLEDSDDKNILKLVYSTSKSILNVISPRDFISVFQQRRLENGSGHLLLSKGVDPTLYSHPVHPLRTRGMIHISGWFVEPLRLKAEGVTPKTKLTHVAHVDFAGSLPAFLLSSATGQQGEILVKVKRALKNTYFKQ